MLYAGDIIFAVARYSTDFRTVHVDDVRAKNGAANVDSRASDLAKLPEELVALYDDGSATPDKVLYFGDRLAAGGDHGM